MSLNRYRLRHLVKKYHKSAIRVNQMLTSPDRLLSLILIGSTVTNIVASMVATLIGQNWGDAGVFISTILLSLIILVFAETVPKTLAALYPQQVAFAFSLPLLILQKLFFPIIKITSYITKTILKLFGISMDKVQRESLSTEELRSVVYETGSILPTEHKSMVISLLDLERITVEDIMIPKADIVGINLLQPWHEILKALETAQHTRLPLFKGSIDNLVGMVHVRMVLHLALNESLTMENLLKITDKPYYIPEATPLNLQIINFQKMKKRSCFVVDEYGDLLGLVTLEDILEEVVGDFTTDISNLGKDIMYEEDGAVIVDASLTLRHLSRVLGWQFPILGPRTLSGLIIEYLGYIPPAQCCLQINKLQIEILKVSDNIIKTVRIVSNSRFKPGLD